MTLSPVFALADRVVEGQAVDDPVTATYRGVPGHEERLTDHSPAAAERRRRRTQEWLDELETLPVLDDADALAAAVLRERLGCVLALHGIGQHLRDVNVLGSPLQNARNVFTLMPVDTDEQWRTIAARMEQVPWSLGTLREAFAEGVAQGVVPARRQVLGAADVAAVCAGLQAAPSGVTEPWFETFVQGYRGGDRELEARLAAAAADAGQAYASLATWMREVHAPAASGTDGVGRDRYVVHAGVYLGARLDPEETYAWAWTELAAIHQRMVACAGRLYGGVTPAEAAARLDVDPEHVLLDPEQTRTWLQGVIDETTASFDGRYFDIPPQMLRCEATLAPPGSAAAPYYTGPNEDFSRPGRTWLPVIGEPFRTWWLLSVWHHEAVPGHHLQIGYARAQRDRLSRFQRLSTVSGHAEGWALYAERLMDELGYYADPADELGFLSNQAMRAVRVVVDIGLHLGLAVPSDADPALLDDVEGLRPGTVWTPSLARDFLRRRGLQTAGFAASEVDRYLGLPGQAICYKVGERRWLAARERAQAAGGAGFDLKAWHMRALGLGSVGLDVLDERLARPEG